MAVVIHEFEVVAEKPPAEEQAGAAPAAGTPAPSSTPHDIERIVRRLSERLARVRAH
jgi:hypothetical protein